MLLLYLELSSLALRWLTPLGYLFYQTSLASQAGLGDFPGSAHSSSFPPTQARGIL